MTELQGTQVPPTSFTVRLGAKLSVPESHFTLILSDNDMWGDLYATIEPAGSRWLPWKGRMSRWWFEVERIERGEAFPSTLAYEFGGSGGGFTLAKCVQRAAVALDLFVKFGGDDE